MEKRVKMENADIIAAVYGACNENIDTVAAELGVSFYYAEGDAEASAVTVKGESYEAVEKAAALLSYLREVVLRGDDITEQVLNYGLSLAKEGEWDGLEDFGSDTVCLTVRGKPIKPKTIGQKRYVAAIRKNTVTFGIGPAGTGKTVLAVALAVDALRKKEVNRIILTRPAVEAGERLGFLPGDLQSKIDPYLRPLYDALFEMLGAENYSAYLEKGMIEIAPLAYMRGRTLDDSFIILDEAQNTSPEQMKMFLTRLGNHSKAIITGDPSQTDLPGGVKSGLSVAVRILKGIEDIAIHTFTERDVVRHKLVQRIILAYEKYDRDRAVKEREEHGKKGYSFKKKKEEKP